MQKQKTFRVRFEVDIYVEAMNATTAESIGLDYLVQANNKRWPAIVTTTGLHRDTKEIILGERDETDV